MDMWTFRCYISKAGTDEIRAWYELQEPDVRADFLAVIEVLRVIPEPYWRKPDYCRLQGVPCKGLGELRLKVNGVHYRIFGYFGPGSTDFTLLVPIKKSDDPAYKRACPLAQARRVETA